MFVDRRRDRPVRYLEWRVRLFGAGALLGVVGIATDTGWLVWAAILVLAAGFLLRFVPERDESEGEGSERQAEVEG